MVRYRKANSKPNKEFFDYCFNSLNNPPKEDVILIGDSLSADILGGINYNIKTIFISYYKQYKVPSCMPT